MSIKTAGRIWIWADHINPSIFFFDIFYLFVCFKILTYPVLCVNDLKSDFAYIPTEVQIGELCHSLNCPSW